MEAYTGSLCLVLKDYRNADAIEKLVDSFKKSVKKKVVERGYDLDDVAVKDGRYFTTKPVKIVLLETLCDDVRQAVLEGLLQVKHLNFDFKLMNLGDEGKNIYLKLQNLFNLP